MPTQSECNFVYMFVHRKLGTVLYLEKQCHQRMSNVRTNSKVIRSKRDTLLIWHAKPHVLLSPESLPSIGRNNYEPPFRNVGVLQLTWISVVLRLLHSLQKLFVSAFQSCGESDFNIVDINLLERHWL